MTLYGNTVEDTRSVFYITWKKYRAHEPLSSLESQLLTVILMHPEYHHLLESNAALHKRYSIENGETNPFLHMGLHLTIREQVSTNRPFGIKEIYQALDSAYHDQSQVEHLMMEKLAQCLWQANKDSTIPDETHYLIECKRLMP